jgi:hypothetical protein
MIILVKQGTDRMVFDNVTDIKERSKEGMLGGTYQVINLFDGDEILAGGDDINLTGTEIILLPNAEKED